MDSEVINKEEIVKYLKKLNEYERIKIDGTDRERLIFKNRDEIFNIFGSEDKEVLNPFNDYTYEWLNSFLYSVIDYINYNDFENFEDLKNKINEILPEWIDSEVNVYTYDLTTWLNNNNSNVYYMDEALKEFGHIDDGFKLLQLAQYKAIEELYYNALNLLIEDLKKQFE